MSKASSLLVLVFVCKLLKIGNGWFYPLNGSCWNTSLCTLYCWRCILASEATKPLIIQRCRHSRWIFTCMWLSLNFISKHCTTSCYKDFLYNVDTHTPTSDAQYLHSRWQQWFVTAVCRTSCDSCAHTTPPFPKTPNPHPPTNVKQTVCLLVWHALTQATIDSLDLQHAAPTCSTLWIHCLAVRCAFLHVWDHISTKLLKCLCNEVKSLHIMVYSEKNFELFCVLLTAAKPCVQITLLTKAPQAILCFTINSTRVK